MSDNCIATVLLSLSLDAFLTKLEELGNELVQALSESLDQELEQSLLSVLKEGVAASVTVRETCWWMPRDKV